MRIEAFSHPKARDLSVPADDVMVHVPGRMTAVFDGATDAHGRYLSGVPIGRLAAMTAAEEAASLPAEAIDWPKERILSRLSAALARHLPEMADGAPASTTAMIAFEGSGHVRLVGLGDTGYRVNGERAEVAELPPDQASTPTRVALFRHFLAMGQGMEACEATSRRYICLGLDLAVSDGVLSPAQRDGMIDAAISAHPATDAGQEISAFLRGGLQHQYRYANAPGRALGYGVLNGQEPDCSRAVDREVPRAGLTSLELFTDGYMVAPEEASVEAWERMHAALESRDPYKIGENAACKGSTVERFFDDRTIVILKCA